MIEFYLNIRNYDISNCYPICEHYYYFDESNNFHCNETCPKKYKLIINKTKCIDNCYNDNIYQYEYNNTCYLKCPDDTYLLEDDDYICYNETPNNYYFDSVDKKYNK